MKTNFDNFQMQKWVSETVRARKEDEWTIFLVFMSPFWLMILKLSQIVSFLQFFADVSKKSKAALVAYAYASKISRFALLENGICYYQTWAWSLDRRTSTFFILNS